MDPTEKIIKAAEEINRGIADDMEPEIIAERAIKKMEDIIAEMEKKEEESKEFELSLKGKVGDVLSERAVIKGNSKAIARAMEEYSTVLKERDELKLKVIELEHKVEHLTEIDIESGKIMAF